MLVLSRRPGESIVIGEDVVVTIVSVHQEQVRVGVAAPREVPVHRSEVLEAIRAANQQASSPPAAQLARLGRLVPQPGTRGPQPSTGTGAGGATGTGTEAP